MRTTFAGTVVLGATNVALAAAAHEVAGGAGPSADLAGVLTALGLVSVLLANVTVGTTVRLTSLALLQVGFHLLMAVGHGGMAMGEGAETGRTGPAMVSPGGLGVSATMVFAHGAAVVVGAAAIWCVRCGWGRLVAVLSAALARPPLTLPALRTLGACLQAGCAPGVFRSRVTLRGAGIRGPPAALLA